jgi:hypothetical protein
MSDVEFVVRLRDVVGKLATDAARRRGMSPEALLSEISSGVLVKGCIDRQREAWADWRMAKRAREANGIGPRGPRHENVPR